MGRHRDRDPVDRATATAVPPGRTVEHDPSTRSVRSADAPTAHYPLGTFVHARSGDKGGDANVGLWVGGPLDELRERRIGWLLKLITPEPSGPCCPRRPTCPSRSTTLPNLGGVNVLIRGLLGDGVAASTRFDPQAKAVGEFLRSRLVHIPEELL